MSSVDDRSNARLESIYTKAKQQLDAESKYPHERAAIFGLAIQGFAANRGGKWFNRIVIAAQVLTVHGIGLAMLIGLYYASN